MSDLEDEASQRMRRIAWIDEDIDLFGAVVRTLGRHGYVVDKYYNAAEALEATDQIIQCDAIIADVILAPGLARKGKTSVANGIGLVERLGRAGYSGPVIIVSVVNSGSLRDQYELPDIPEEHILKKPIDLLLLLRTLDEALSGQRDS